MTDQGLVQVVRSSTLGSYVALAASIGAGTLVVESSLDFNETGGSLLLNGVTYPYMSVNYDTDTITLTGTLSVAAVLTDRVDVLPLSTEKQALVVTAGSEDAVTVRVPHALVPLLPEGVRTDAEMESVQFEWVNGVFILTDVVGRTPVLDGGYIDDTTLPPPASDGLPPSSTPALTAQGNIGAIHYNWTPVANADPYRFKLYVDTTSGFTRGPGNLVADTAGSSFTYIPSPLNYGISYFAVLVEYDEDGEAAPSAEVAAQLRPATNEDISAAYAYLGQVLVDQLRGGTLAADILLSSTITTRGGGTGAGLDLNQDLTRYDSAGQPTAVLGDTNSFKGNIEADNVTVTGPAAFRSAVELSRGGVWTLQQGTTPPVSPPIATVGWPDPAVEDEISGGYGLAWADSEWHTVVDQGDGSSDILHSTSSSTALGGSPARPWGGVARIGSNWYVLGWKLVAGVYQWFLKKYNLSGTEVLSTSYTPIGTAFGSGADFASNLGVAAVGTDGTNLLVGEFDSANDRYRIQIRDATTMSISSTLNTSANAGFTGPVTGIKGGSFDFGSTRYVILTKDGGHLYPFIAAGTYQVNEAFPAPAPGQMSGMEWDGTRFWTTRAKHITGNAWVYKHTTYKWNDVGSTKTHYATSTWRDTNATGGTHETSMGSTSSFQMKKRAGLTLTSSAIPAGGGTDDPNAVSFYLGIVDTARTNLWRQTLPADGVNTVTVGDGITFAGTNPPSSNNFPGAVPAVVKNSAGTLEISGDGSIEGSSIAIGATPVLALTQVLQAVCTSNVDLTTTEVDITGATLTFSTVRPNAQFLCTGSFYMAAITGGSAVATGKLSVDTTNQSTSANFTGVSTLERANVSQSWTGTLASAGSHTFKLRGVQSAMLPGTPGAGAFRVNSGSTAFTVMVFE